MTLMQSETQAASTRIWTRVANSISQDDNRYAKWPSKSDNLSNNSWVGQKGFMPLPRLLALTETRGSRIGTCLA